ncbi:uncharacterized protein [Cardiocondyla obscurior]|uniref:uncharacterized protein n=1 Tax=Cardiocondyla obscurior TaxID=286306 RepID=UPI0039658503
MTLTEAWTGTKPYVGFMRIFGSKVIALNKESKRNKFEPKGEEYILVGYSKESKANRLWKPKTRKVIKRRDVRFHKKLSKENRRTNDYFEAPTDILETVEQHAKKETPQSTVSKTEKQDVEEDNTEKYAISPKTEPFENKEIRSTYKRGSGRPRVQRTGRPGRPRKLFQDAANVTYKKDLDEPDSVEDIYSREDKDL